MTKWRCIGAKIDFDVATHLYLPKWVKSNSWREEERGKSVLTMASYVYEHAYANRID